MKSLAILSILLLCPAIFAQQQPDLQFSIFNRTRTLAATTRPDAENRPTPPAIFAPVFVGVIKDDTGHYIGFLQTQTDVVPLKTGDTLAFNHLQILDLNLSRMLLSNNTTIPLGNDLLNRPHYLPTAPLLASAATPNPLNPTARPSRRGNIGNPFFPATPNQPITRGRNPALP